MNDYFDFNLVIQTKYKNFKCSVVLLKKDIVENSKINKSNCICKIDLGHSVYLCHNLFNIFITCSISTYSLYFSCWKRKSC